MRWGSTLASLVALVVLADGCGDDRASSNSQDVGNAMSAAPEAAVERFGFPAGPAAQVNEFVAVGTTVLGFGPSNSAGHLAVVTSTDLGESWQPLVLPGTESPGFVYTAVEARDGTAWVTGLDGPGDVTVAAERAHLWVSRDGVDWSGGLLPTTQPPSTLVEPGLGLAGDGTVVAGVVTDRDERGEGIELFTGTGADAGWVPADMPEVLIEGAQAAIGGIWQADDRLVAAVYADSSPSLTVLESGDNGRSWQVGSCPVDSTVVNDDDECEPVAATGSLRVGPRGVSVDGGGWSRPVIEPPPVSGDARAFGIDEPVDLPDSGWLAAGGVYLNQEETFGVLARSEDGVTWQQLFADDPCVGDDLHPEFTTPVRFGDGWSVTHACREPASGSIWGDVAWSDLYVLDRAATEPVQVAGTRQDGREYLQPLTVGDVVLVPVVEVGDSGAGLVGIVRLTP